jgi:hypothetical protein
MKRLYYRQEAAAYLGMSPSSFDTLVSPAIPYVLIGRTGKRYDRLDLDDWADRQVKIVPAGVAAQETACTTHKNRPDSRLGARSGTSTRSSGSVGNGPTFESQLDAARSRRRAAS